jgi:hypothetical protein
MWSYLDCAGTNVPVIRFDPNNLDEDETDPEEAVLRWTNAFWHEARSFAGWLEDWVADRPRPDPTWPREVWLRQRLWPGRPENVRLFLKALTNDS